MNEEFKEQGGASIPEEGENWSFRRHKDQGHSHYSDKTGHRERGHSAKAGHKPRDRFYRGGTGGDSWELG